MAQPIKTKGIIIRQVNYGDYDKMLTCLTEDFGRISVSAKGVRSIKSKKRAACELLCYDELVLSPPRGDVYTLSECSCIESFYALREDCVKLALGIYMADVAGHLSPEDMAPTLKLLLNSLYMLQSPKADIFWQKLLYDLKLLQAAGFTPETEECVSCQRKEGPFAFSALSGGVLCKRCASISGIPFTKERTLQMISVILRSPLSKSLYEFSADGETVKDALRLTEAFISVHIRDEIKTLEYYNKLVKML